MDLIDATTKTLPGLVDKPAALDHAWLSKGKEAAVASASLVRVDQQIVACYFPIEWPDFGLKRVWANLGIANYKRAPSAGAAAGEVARFGYFPDAEGYVKPSWNFNVQRAAAGVVNYLGEKISELAHGNMMQKAVVHMLTARNYKAQKDKSRMFTSCVLNRNIANGYHRDTGNLPGTLTAVAFHRDAARGGYLVMPELGLAFKPQTGFAMIYDGAAILHGVTKVDPVLANGCRISLVAHCRKGLA